MKQENRIDRVIDNIRLLKQRAQPILELTVSHSEHYNIVVMSFLSRMIGQINTIMAIRPRKDADLITRSMVEAYALLNWMSRVKRSRSTRARRYRAIFYVNLLVRYDQIIEGCASRAEKKKYRAIRAGFVKQVTKNAKNVLDQKEIAEILAGRPMPFKDFWRRLTGKKTKMRDLFRLAEKQRGRITEEAYRRYYALLSQSHHWEPLSLDTEWDEKKELVTYSEESEDTYFRALSIAYVTLSETIKIAANAFRKEEISHALSHIDRSHLLLWSPEQRPDRSPEIRSLAIPNLDK
jgi:hypothetical protein